jgi:hypothetical protein
VVAGVVVEVGDFLVASAGGDQEIAGTRRCDSAGDWNGPALSAILHDSPSDYTRSQSMSSVMVLATVIVVDPFVCRAGGTCVL